MDDQRYGEINAGHTGAETDSFTEERYRQFSRLLRVEAADVLDVGCSTGRGGRVLREALPHARLVGLDCVAERVDRLPPCYAGFVLASSTAIPSPEGSFDAVVAGEFIEHLTPEDVSVTLREFERILRPGGMLLLTTPNPGYWRLRLTGRRVIGGAHLSEHPPDRLAAAVRSAGFGGIVLLPSGKMTRLVGEGLPLWVYGSYLLRACKPDISADEDRAAAEPG